MPSTLEPSELRPALHAKVDQLDGKALAILHRIALQLELDQVVAGVDAESAEPYPTRERTARLLDRAEP